jgi:hypothetical protein
MRFLKEKCECGGWICATFIEIKNETTGFKEIVVDDLRCIDCNKPIIIPFMTEREFFKQFGSAGE